MNLNIQFQMEDIRKKKEQASKDKSSSNILITIGGILLVIGVGFGILGILSAIGSTLPGAETLENSSLGLGCCFSFALLFLIPGVIFLGLGIVRRKNANDEIRIVEEENLQLRRLMIMEEAKRNKTDS